MKSMIVRSALAIVGSLALAGTALAGQGSPRTAPAGSQPIGSAVSRGGGDSGGGGGSSWGGGSTTGSSGGGETIQSTSGRGSGSSGRSRAVASGGRSRGNRTQIGTAEARQRPPDGGGGGWNPGYWWGPDYYWGYGGVGLGYFAIDPYWWGGWSDPWGGSGYYGEGGGYATRRDDAIGQLRLKVKPKQAQVFVDGSLAGTVDEFDGTFERLDLVEGPHHVELRLEGLRTLTFNVNIVADELTTYRGKMEPVQ